jgi:D-amino peptidase
MKFMIAVDGEGEACVVGAPGKIVNHTPNWDFAWKQGVREANAAACGLFDAGATEVVIWDCHYGGVNWDYDLIDSRCDIALGAGAPRRWPGLDKSFAGVLFVGYHAMDNTPGAVLAHTYDPDAYQWVKINGVEIGEIEIDAAIAGMVSVPLIFVASDDKGVAEAKRFMPHVQTVATKRGLGWNVCISKHPRRAAEEIHLGAKLAAERLKEMKLFKFKMPGTMEVRYKRIECAQAAVREPSPWVRIDPFTVRRKVSCSSDIF